MSGPAPNRPRGEMPQCDTGKGVVGADGLLGTVLAVSSLSAFASDAAGAGAALGLLGIGFIASAVRGNTVANECRASLDQFAAAQRPDRPARERRPRMAVQPGAPIVETPPPIVAPPPPEPATTAPFETPGHPVPATPPPTPAKPAVSAKLPGSAKPPVAATPKPEPADEDWRDFWKEAP